MKRNSYTYCPKFCEIQSKMQRESLLYSFFTFQCPLYTKHIHTLTLMYISVYMCMYMSLSQKGSYISGKEKKRKTKIMDQSNIPLEFPPNKKFNNFVPYIFI